MIRGIGYRTAATVFVFAGLWFVLGLLTLASPLPHALGIGGEMFVAWFLLFLTILAMAGASLTMAALNGLFPPDEARPTETPVVDQAARLQQRVGAVAGRRPEPQHPAATDTHDAEGRPLPWTGSALPERSPRRRSGGPRPLDPRQER